MLTTWLSIPECKWKADLEGLGGEKPPLGILKKERKRNVFFLPFKNFLKIDLPYLCCLSTGLLEGLWEASCGGSCFDLETGSGLWHMRPRGAGKPVAIPFSFPLECASVTL